MAVRTSEATWHGSLREGSGTMKLGSGFCEGPYTFASRFEEEPKSNPEEFVAAAHAGCFSMFLSSILTADDHTPNKIHTEAKVHLGRVNGAPTITAIELNCEGDVPGIDRDTFLDYANRAKAECPVSKALAAVDVISLEATLVN